MAATETDNRDFVCFASAFRSEGSLNISHATLDGERTLCGRTGWETSEGWDDDHTPDCLRCARSLAKIRQRSAPDHQPDEPNS